MSNHLQTFAAPIFGCDTPRQGLGPARQQQLASMASHAFRVRLAMAVCESNLVEVERALNSGFSVHDSLDRVSAAHRGNRARGATNGARSLRRGPRVAL